MSSPDATPQSAEATPCQRLGHDYEFLGRRYYEGSRSGHMVDEFYCRRCLRTEMRQASVSDKWYSERQR